jgi:dihydroflavonol-4-reductase
VDGLRHVLDAALDAKLKRFVFTSTIGALAVSDSRVVTEEDPHNWDQGDAYIEARVAAEKMVMAYAHDKGLPAVAMCIANTYGPRDWGPTPHGSLIAQVADGRFPFYLGYASEVVGIEDAARAMLLAAEHGRDGER